MDHMAFCKTVNYVSLNYREDMNGIKNRYAQEKWIE